MDIFVEVYKYDLYEVVHFKIGTSTWIQNYFEPSHLHLIYVFILFEIVKTVQWVSTSFCCGTVSLYGTSSWLLSSGFGEGPIVTVFKDLQLRVII